MVASMVKSGVHEVARGVLRWRCDIVHVNLTPAVTTMQQTYHVPGITSRS
jgi:hypothetical protein